MFTYIIQCTVKLKDNTFLGLTGVRVLRDENDIDEKERELQQAHIDRLTRNECTPEAGMLYSDIISGLERVADHATNIAFATALQS